MKNRSSSVKKCPLGSRAVLPGIGKKTQVFSASSYYRTCYVIKKIEFCMVRTQVTGRSLGVAKMAKKWPSCKFVHVAMWRCYDTFSRPALCGVSIPRGALSTVTLRHRQTAKFHLAALDISVNCTAVIPYVASFLRPPTRYIGSLRKVCRGSHDTRGIDKGGDKPP